MKTPSPELFQLIKSMNTQEKVQFKMYASRKKKNSGYVQIFDAMDAQKKYDEAAIKKKLKNVPHVKKFDNAKTYIIEAILKCLQEYYSNDSTEGMLCNYIYQAELLINKELYSLARKIISKAETLASRENRYAYLLAILSLKRRVMVIGQARGEAIAGDHREVHRNELQTIELHKNLIAYQQLWAITIGLVIQNRKDENAANEVRAILQNPLLKHENRALSYPARVLYHEVLGDICRFLNKAQKSYAHLKKAIGYAGPARDSAQNKIANYSQIMVLLAQLGRQEDLLMMKNEAVRVAEAIPKKLFTTAVFRRYLALMNNYTDYQLSRGNVEEALLQMDNIRDQVVKHGAVQGLIVYYSNRSLAAFYSGDYRQALHYSNKALLFGKRGIRHDIIVSVRFFTLVVHYEQGNEHILPNLCRSLSRYLDKTPGRYGEFEKTLLGFFGRSIVHAAGKREKTTAFAEFKKKLETCDGNGAMDGFDYISWAESNIQNKPMVEILKEKSLKV